MEENQILRGHDGKVWIVHLTGSNAVICRCMSRFSLQGAKQVNSHYTSGHHKERNECIEASDVAVRGFVNTVKQGNAAKHPAFTPFNAQLLFDWDETEKEKFVLDVVILWCLRYWKTTRANQSTRAGCCKLNFVHCAEMGPKLAVDLPRFPQHCSQMQTNCSVSKWHLKPFHSRVWGKLNNNNCKSLRMKCTLNKSNDTQCNAMR